MADPAADQPVDGGSPLTAAEASGTLDQDTLYSVLANPRRRNAVHYLKQQTEPVSVSDLAEQVAAWENNKPPEELTSQERKRVYISLYQSHLDTLDKAGIVEYNEDAGTVTLSDAIRRRRIYLEIVPRNDIPWSLYYLGLTVAGGAIIALAWFDVHPFRLVPDLGWALVVLILFGVSAFVQTYATRRRELGDIGPPTEPFSD